jgi:MFS family permease
MSNVPEGINDESNSSVKNFKNANKVLWLMGFGVVLILYVHTALAPALPQMVSDFQTDYNIVNWVLTAYLVSGAAVTIVIGRLADLYGAKKMLLIVFICFAVGTTLAPLAQDIYTLIAIRVLQGVAVALVPLCIRIARDIFPDKKLPMAQGVILSMYQGGSAVGLVMGAVVVYYGGWQLLFMTAIPFSFLFLFLFWKFIPKISPVSAIKEGDTSPHIETKKRKFTSVVDIPGVITLVLTISAFMLAFTFLGQGSETFGLFISFLIIGIVSLVLFLIIEKMSKNPLVDLKIQFHKTIRIGNFIFLMLGIVQYIIFSTIPVLGQTAEPHGLGMNPLFLGLLQLPMALAFVILGPIMGVIAIKYGNLRFLIPGAILLTVGLFLLSAFHSTVAETAGFLVFFALGGVFLTLIPNVILLAAPRESTGTVSAVTSTMRIIGGAIGPVLSGALLTIFVIPVDNPTNTSASVPSEMAFNVIFVIAAVISIAMIFMTAILKRRATSTKMSS